MFETISLKCLVGTVVGRMRFVLFAGTEFSIERNNSTEFSRDFENSPVRCQNANLKQPASPPTRSQTIDRWGGNNA